MRITGLLVVTSIASVGAVWLVVSGWRQPRPALVDAVRRLSRGPDDLLAADRRASRPSDGSADAIHAASEPALIDRIGALGASSALVERHLVPLAALRLVQRAPQTHVGYLIVGSLLGLIVPSVVLGLAAFVGIVSFGLMVPAGVSLVSATAVPLVIHSSAMSDADDVRVDLRHQLSAYLDMVTMLLAGNTGHEGALEQAAASGDGLLFRELRRRMREVATTGNSMVGALALVGRDLDLAELDQVAAATALSASEGSPVARTLAARCSTLRSTLAADQEAKARVRNDKLTPPLVGMALLFMALIIYPALDIG